MKVRYAWTDSQKPFQKAQSLTPSSSTAVGVNQNSPMYLQKLIDGARCGLGHGHVISFVYDLVAMQRSR